MSTTDVATLALLLMFAVSSVTIVLLFRRDARRERRVQEQYDLDQLNAEYKRVIEGQR